jgi:hypothetical protein
MGTMADLTIADVAEIKSYLSRTCEEAMRWLPGTGWEPGWKSEAASEVRNREQRAGDSAWGEAPVRTTYAAAAAFLIAAIDSLSALADSVNLLTTTFVPNVLVRAAMEAASQAWWLLEPGIGARRRVIRSILIRASSARYLGQAVRKIDPAGKVSDYGEDQAMVRAYAKDLGLTYICNSDKIECETEDLPGYTARATEFEKAVGVSAAYKIYSGAAHAELYLVMQSWRPTAAAGGSAPLLERWPEREAVWASVIVGAGFIMVPAFRALVLLGRNARIKELTYSMQRNRELARRMRLLEWSW